MSSGPAAGGGRAGGRGHLTLARLLISASRGRPSARRSSLHALPTPRCRAPSSPLPHTREPPLPSPSCCCRVHLGEPEPLPGYTALRPLSRVPMGRSGRDSAGVFSPGPGHERGPEKGTEGQGEMVSRAEPPAPGDPLGSPGSAPRSHGPQPHGSQACQSRPAFRRPLCPITAALSIRTRSRQSQPA